jgi:hypothetical protein
MPRGRPRSAPKLSPNPQQHLRLLMQLLPDGAGKKVARTPPPPTSIDVWSYEKFCRNMEAFRFGFLHPDYSAHATQIPVRPEHVRELAETAVRHMVAGDRRHAAGDGWFTIDDLNAVEYDAEAVADQRAGASVPSEAMRRHYTNFMMALDQSGLPKLLPTDTSATNTLHDRFTRHYMRCCYHASSALMLARVVKFNRDMLDGVPYYTKAFHETYTPDSWAKRGSARPTWMRVPPKEISERAKRYPSKSPDEFRSSFDITGSDARESIGLPQSPFTDLYYGVSEIWPAKMITEAYKWFRKTPDVNNQYLGGQTVERHMVTALQETPLVDEWFHGYPQTFSVPSGMKSSLLFYGAIGIPAFQSQYWRWALCRNDTLQKRLYRASAWDSLDVWDNSLGLAITAHIYGMQQAMSDALGVYSFDTRGLRSPFFNQTPPGLKPPPHASPWRIIEAFLDNAHLGINYTDLDPIGARSNPPAKVLQPWSHSGSGLCPRAWHILLSRIAFAEFCPMHAKFDSEAKLAWELEAMNDPELEKPVTIRNKCTRLIQEAEHALEVNVFNPAPNDPAYNAGWRQDYYAGWRKRAHLAHNLLFQSLKTPFAT